MNKDQLQRLLDAEVKIWSAKPYGRLRDELGDVTAIQRGDAADFHQFEVQLLERTDDFVHVSVSIDDGSFRGSFSPLTTSFIVYKDGRVDG